MPIFTIKNKRMPKMSSIKLHIRRRGNSFNLVAQFFASILTKKYGRFILIRVCSEKELN